MFLGKTLHPHCTSLVEMVTGEFRILGVTSRWTSISSSRNIDSRFDLQYPGQPRSQVSHLPAPENKVVPGIRSDLMGYLARIQTLPTLIESSAQQNTEKPFITRNLPVVRSARASH